MGLTGSNGRGRKARPSRAPAAAKKKVSAKGAAKVKVTVNGKRATTGIVVDKPLKFTIPSKFEAGREVQKRILDDVTRLGYTSHSQFAIKLALEEALINAIKHGNRLDPKKKVHIEFSVTPKQLEVTIEDEGPGFSRDEVPDPTLQENLEKCSGRGILLIEAYMSSVQWSNGGRRLKMVLKNEEDVLPRK
jgi:serine/threonine-protein kinase RsbW